MIACELPFFAPRLAAYGTVLVGGWPVAVAWYGRPVRMRYASSFTQKGEEETCGTSFGMGMH